MEKLSKYFLSIFVLFLAFSCAEKGKDYSALSKEERKKLSSEVFDGGSHLPQGSPKSMTRIEEAIAIDPDNCDAVRELSVAYLKRGMPNKWKIEMDKAVACNTAIWQPYRGYNYLWFYRDYKKAIADFDASDTLTPNFTDAPQGHSVDYWRGIAYLGLRDYEKSISYFDKYLTQITEESGEDWAEPTAFLYRGIAYYEKRNFEEALKDFDKLLFYNKDRSADGKYYKALILKEKEDCETSRQLLAEAETDFANGYYNNRHYVETLYQIYPQDFEKLNTELKTQCQNKNETY
ncbi:tetratricopeptide repeat protein [Aequorivita aquimaris]|uniref:tetratricopeptide repeat protein n=1 Tax=Aequorivita aquimaris TaxID=1548749 RepID=UPI0007887DA4|nr:tetratricopeptide repeat protein [Aequorivita aquimaris]